MDQKVTAEDMIRYREDLKRTRHETYKIILAQIHEDIKLYTSKGATSMRVLVPPVVLNRPVYPAKSAAQYVSLSLQRDGFEVATDVDGSGAHYLTVSWKPKPRKARDAKKAARATHEKAVQETRTVNEAVKASQNLSVLKAKLRHFLA